MKTTVELKTILINLYNYCTVNNKQDVQSRGAMQEYVPAHFSQRALLIDMQRQPGE